MAKAFENPYPVLYKLSSILDLFKKEYFQEEAAKDVNYADIRTGLQTFLLVCIIIM